MGDVMLLVIRLGSAALDGLSLEGHRRRGMNRCEFCIIAQGRKVGFERPNFS